MAPLTSDALVLRSYPLRETSRIVVLLTRDRGKVRSVARGARSPRSRIASGLDPLSEVRVTLHGRQGAELMTLGACDVLHSTFAAAGRGAEAGVTLSYVAELVDAFASEGEAEDALYRLARSVSLALEAGVTPAWLARYAEMWTLRLHGIYPSASACASCGGALGQSELRYDDRAHGFICNSCGRASGPVLPGGTRELLRQFFAKKPDELKGVDQEALLAIEALHQKLIVRHIEREVRSYRVLRDVAREMHR